ncbi:N-acetyl-1-D-myo-inositol-2-amino-2-deoxy-alpha-D-glucopyranoside deacetylase [Saccharomonospora sp. CUA-673]|uniref:N-acetyl-1-D-myo-inositol-2-amino-2-deoxy-alpha- D-glucopyranoside deacetylase n=1 Tax=Saccharomonospora sp. CUA-673 TaxID=1904969 RepID=UPI00095BD99C|nr:N-acetyl-1-D-myo-inositol-2-amino-2-deoxy-alpha-D-glucopyranoside deacetylase [Saccharomonospora sp. CUA-673]OLT42064.1 N-acetyl-1-D-myo-inositol-2-amino-2-deoxy-alpha-D-glucopyranoside deacetylase [Saccharomonospora sp. CUA-673]
MISGNGRSVVLVHAHPDDESITTGGTIARYAAAGAHVTVVTCTLGEEGEIIPSALGELGAWASDQLGGYRSGELAAAGAALGWTGHRYLGGIGRWRDSGMAGTPAAEHPRALAGGDVDRQTAQLVELLDELRPQVVVTYDAHGGYGHPDHIRAHDITMAAAPRAASVRRVFHTVSSRGAVHAGLAELRSERPTAAGELPVRVPADDELPTTPDADITTVVDIAAYRRHKIAALAAHETQIAVGSDAWFALSNGIAQPVPDAEYFVLAHGPAEGCETDLFGGLALDGPESGAGA